MKEQTSLLVAANVMLEKGLIDQTNARLIAAASCLLEACKRIVSVYNFKKKCNEPFEMDDLAIEVLNDAIKKATGETL